MSLTRMYRYYIFEKLEKFENTNQQKMFTWPENIMNKYSLAG